MSRECLFCGSTLSRDDVAIDVMAGVMHDDCAEDFNREQDAAFPYTDERDDGYCPADEDEYEPSDDAADYGWQDGGDYWGD